MHDLSQDCRSEFSQVPQSDPGPLSGLGSARWILLFPKVGASSSLASLRIALPDAGLCSLGGRLCWDPTM